jgi:hypothetical protein
MTNVFTHFFCAGEGAQSWPMANLHTFIVHQSTMSDCTKAAALVDWIYWTQTSAAALDLAARYVLRDLSVHHSTTGK